MNIYFIYRKQNILTEYYINLQQEQEKNKTLNSQINYAFEEVLELAKKNDPAFLSRFQEVYHEFYEKIMVLNPTLTNNELSFCALLKLNFSTKEIAKYTFLAIKTIENKKNKIRKKLNISSEVDLNVWMRKL